MTELSDLQNRNDDLMKAKDADLAVIRDLDAQLKEYKRKYEQAKTELRSIKGVLYNFRWRSVTDFDSSYIPAILAATQSG